LILRACRSGIWSPFERARQLAKDLDQYVLDVEKILKEAKKELGIKIPL